MTAEVEFWTRANQKVTVIDVILEFLFCGVTSNHEGEGWRISAVLLAINAYF